MNEHGTVISIDREYAIVQINRGEKCDGCTVCQSFGENKMRIEARNAANACVGDEVDVAIEARHIIRNSMLIFILPLLFMIGGYFIGISLSESQSESSGILGAFIALAISFGGLRLLEKTKNKSSEDAVIVALYEK